MTTFILVSHSKKITDGLKEMIEEMTGKSDAITIVSVGGTDSGELGTDPMRILSELELHRESDHIYLLADIGSAVMSIDSALELTDEDLKVKCTYIDGPLVEGAFVGSIQAMVNADKEEIIKAVRNIYGVAL